MEAAVRPTEWDAWLERDDDDSPRDEMMMHQQLKKPPSYGGKEAGVRR